MKKKQIFHKYTALGNDYIVIDQKNLKSKITSHLVKKMCQRNFGIGADGVLLVEKVSKNLFKLKIFNSDGSTAGKSGNGMRIAAHYLSQTYSPANQFQLQIKQKIFFVEKWQILKNNFKASIQMGESVPILIPQNCTLPFKFKKDKLFVKIKGTFLPAVVQDMGNPHLSLVDEERKLSKQDLISFAREIQMSKYFKKSKGVNVQLVHPVNKKKIKIYIYERGSGYTLASGSSSCAVALAAQKLDPLIKFPIHVKNEQGELRVSQKDGQIYLEGKCCHLFQGLFFL
ncbi:diaminopimelate epimerase [Bacteriovoracaceae bacterium]|nr:diaminopimelate epimerase [Bacteriovoracaceae bacterium]